ncbi:MAG: hypothetical protein C0596_01520 [Marinilabiliales bacterium]|nr:MAG: hypothetical protein C0596_01520 [Marinilabiliales bacterium]
MFFAFGSLFSQDNVGFGTTTPHSSALLDMTASDKGLLIPRVELIAVNDGVNPVNGPATGLLVFNETGALASGFYYWDGTEWVMVGAGGGSSCHTLDEAYDCGGAGAGALIVADANPVMINLPLTGTNDEGLYVQSDKGSTPAPTAAITAVNTMHGAGIYAEISETTNLYSGIQGITYTTLTGSDLAKGVSGYHDGTGIGVGVWGEASSNNAAGSSYGVYGKGSNKTFGGYFYGANWPGGFIETGDVTGVALQVASGGQNPLNWGLLEVGAVQINCGFTGGATGNNIMFNNASGEATMGPDAGSWCYLGGPGLEWWGIYSSNVLQVSRRELKRDITYFNEDLANYVMDDIMELKPAFYKYNEENDTRIEGKEQRTRYNMHLGFILDETPDYIQDNAFSGIDLYSLASLSIAGVQENRRSIEEIEEQITEIHDFGTSKLIGNEIYVPYNKNFEGTQPVVAITPLSPVKDYYIKSQNENGFVLAVENENEFDFNWIVVAHKKVDIKNSEPVVDAQLKAQLEVDEAKKAEIRNELMKGKQTTVELKGKDASKYDATKYQNSTK